MPAGRDLEISVADAVLAVLAKENDADLKAWLDWTFVRPLDQDAVRVKQALGRAAIDAVQIKPSSLKASRLRQQQL